MTLDRITARALVEAGYMPLPEYVRDFGHAPSDPIAASKPASPDACPASSLGGAGVSSSEAA